MNYSYRKNNEVEYCSGLYIVSLRPNTNSRKNPGFHRHKRQPQTHLVS